jgi:hypothetical protein
VRLSNPVKVTYSNKDYCATESIKAATSFMVKAPDG